jgi:signal recognition particle subunit SRP54
LFERLTERLDTALKKMIGRGKIRESDIDEAMREVRRALLEADVNFKLAREFSASVRERAVGKEVLASVSPAQQVVKIVQDELTDLLGGDTVELAKADAPPTVIMVVGLQGSGKTTSAAKLALHLKKSGGRPLLAAADVKRPAAVAQLQTLGGQIDVPVHHESLNSLPEHIARNAVDKAKQGNHTAVIIDTAGRIQIDEEMMAEVERMGKLTKPHEVLLVADAMTGQEAVNVATAFNERVPLTGLILTKMDGDARGGAALSIRAVTGVPVKFLTQSEKMEPLEVFHPDRLASRILGMGDVVTLVEQAQEVIDEEAALRLEEKIRQATFDLNDFLEQFNQIRKMGSLSQIMGMIPGMGKMMNDPGVQDAMTEKNIARTEAIILSMTLLERSRPELIDGSRRRRIAAGSGSEPRDVNQLLNQFKQMQKMMKMLSAGQMPNLPGMGGMSGR